MTGNKENFISPITIKDGKVTFEDNTKGKVVGKGKVGRLPNYQSCVACWRFKTYFVKYKSILQ